jgi:hypothetical protein
LHDVANFSAFDDQPAEDAFERNEPVRDGGEVHLVAALFHGGLRVFLIRAWFWLAGFA